MNTAIENIESTTEIWFIEHKVRHKSGHTTVIYIHKYDLKYIKYNINLIYVYSSIWFKIYKVQHKSHIHIYIHKYDLKYTKFNRNPTPCWHLEERENPICRFTQLPFPLPQKHSWDMGKKSTNLNCYQV